MKSTPRRAKVVCTIGPASADAEMIRKLVDAGMDVARLNFSHGSHDEHRAVIDNIRAAANDAGKPVAILQDLQGPKIRVGRLPNGHVNLEAGATFTLSADGTASANDLVGVSYASFCDDVARGDTVLLDDGRLQLKVLDVQAPLVRCEVVIGGVLSDRKGLNLPGTALSITPLSDKDLADLRFGIAAGVDWVAMSFVQRPDDLRLLRQHIRELGAHTPIVAKIEKPQAVDCLDDIISVTDAIMVARGDLGVELPPEEVPVIQKRIIAACNRAGVPVITATQMLESMIASPRPTRAEASDVANAVLDGTDAVMLSGETAAGQYPLEAVRTMCRIVVIAERDAQVRWDLQRRERQRYVPATTIGYSACHAADMVDATAIVCLTQSGSTARMIARFRPTTPILALTAHPRTCQELALIWGVRPVLTADFADNLDHTLQTLAIQLKAQHWVSTGDRIVVTTGLPFTARRSTNTMRIEDIL